MTAQESLVIGSEEEATQELALHSQIVVLARGVSHVLVHGAHGDALPRVRNRIAGVVSTANATRIGIENRIRAAGIEVQQGVKWRGPSATLPDVFQNAVVVDTKAPPNRHL